MISTIKINDKNVYEYREFVCDSVEEIQSLPRNILQGSNCFVIETSELYMLNGQQEWVKV